MFLRYYIEELSTDWLPYRVETNRVSRYAKNRNEHYLAHGNSTFPRELFLGLLARIGITQMRVEVFVQNFGRLLAEISSLTSAMIISLYRVKQCLSFKSFLIKRMLENNDISNIKWDIYLLSVRTWHLRIDSSESSRPRKWTVWAASGCWRTSCELFGPSFQFLSV